MNRDLTTKELIDLLVKKLRIDYGSFELKIHNGKCTNFTVSKRVNYVELDSEEFLDTKVRV